MKRWNCVELPLFLSFSHLRGNRLVLLQHGHDRFVFQSEQPVTAILHMPEVVRRESCF